MTPRRKALNVLSWLLIVFALVLFIAGCALAALGVAVLSDETASSQAASSDMVMAGLALLGVGVLLALTGAMYFVIGLLGRRGAKHPRKIVPFLVLSTIGLLLAIADAATMLTSGELSVLSVVFSIISVAFPAACVYLAYSIRLHREDVAPGDVAGPDGAQYPDGFNPEKLGFMRVLQVLFAFNIVLSVLSLTVLAKGDYQVGFDELLDLFNVIVDGVFFWFIWQRYKSTRTLAISLSLFNIVVGTGYNLATGAFDLSTQLVLCAGDIIVLIYFVTSRRAHAVLNVPFSTERVASRAQTERDELFRLKTWPFWRSLIIYFCLFCIVGHWMEAAFCLLIKYGIVPGIYDPNSQIWSDWLYPFPVYGFGTAACILILFPVKNFLQRHIHNGWAPLVLSFIINTLVCSGIELTLGLLQNQPINGVYPLWDYSDMFCNFMGQICLQNSLAFGGVATLMTWLIYPGLEKLMGKLTNTAANVLFIVVVIFFALVFSLYCINLAQLV